MGEDRNGVHIVQREHLGAVGGTQPVLAFVPVEAALGGGGVRSGVGEVLGPGVGGVELAGGAEALADIHLERVVIGIERGFLDIDGVETEVRPHGIDARLVGGGEDRVAIGGVQTGVERHAGGHLVDIDEAL